MRIIIKNLAKDNEEEVARAFNCPKECVAVKQNVAEIKFPKIALSQKEELYKLKRGETIFSVARKFNVPEKILRENNGDVDFFGGVTVFIPLFYGKTYQVTCLDTMQTVADKNGISVERLKQLNGISFIFVGQLLIVG